MIEIPFPFFGAGNASYFEWADLHVRFTRAPKPAERTKILKTLPKPLADGPRWEGAHLYVSSEQGVGRVIQAAYAKVPKQPTSLTTTSRFKMADSPKMSRFNEDQERWLLEIHEVVPVLAAYRHQDWEAGGTELSPWHYASLPSAKKVLTAIGKTGAKDGPSYMVRGIKAEVEEAKKKANAAPKPKAKPKTKAKK